MLNKKTFYFLHLLFLPLFLLSCSGCGNGSDKAVTSVTNGNTATLIWNAPMKKIDGSELDDLAGYKIRYGASSGSYSGVITLTTDSVSCARNGDVTQCSYTVQGLTPGITYFVVTAYNKYGSESGYSNEMSKKIDQ